MKRFYRDHKIGLIASGLVLLAALMYGGIASAASPAPQGQPGDTALENFLMREQNAFDGQAARLQAANTIIDKVQNWIDNRSAAGKDTSALQGALDAYKTQIASAQTDHEAAGAVLSGKAGFDADGKVTDRRAAFETVKSAGKSLRRAHRTLVQSTIDFRNAVLTWRKANR